MIIGWKIYAYARAIKNMLCFIIEKEKNKIDYPTKSLQKSEKTVHIVGIITSNLPKGFK